MYSRAKDRPKAPIRLPDHYSGWAFRDPPPNDTPEEPIPHRAPPDAIPLSPSTHNDSSDDTHLSVPTYEAVPHVPSARQDVPCDPTPSRDLPPHALTPPCDVQKKSPAHSPSPSWMHSLGKIGSAFPFSHGLGFDELILLGLILLLSHNDHDPDVLLLLGLLLFCG